MTYANVIATLALFLALGGGAYAALRLPKNSVGSNQIKANAVNSSKVANGSLFSQDFAAGQLPRGPKGDQGPQGPQGERGLQGATGTVDTSNFFDKAASDARYLPIGGTAADAAKLGGFPASGIMKGTGSRHFSSGFSGTVAPGTSSDIISNVGAVNVSCTGSGTNAATSFQFNPGVSGTVWTDSGATNPTVQDVAAGGTSTPVSTTAVDHVELAVLGGGTFADIDVWVRVDSGCTNFDRIDSTR